MNPNRLLFIDMDGTIIFGDYSGRFLCRLAGVDEGYIAQTEADEAASRIDWMEGDRLRTKGFSGLAVARIEENLDDLPIISGLSAFLCAIRDLGFQPVLASAGPHPVVEILAKKYRFFTWFASTYGVKDGFFTGEIDAFLSASGKAENALDLCRSHNIDPTLCAAIGDGDSDAVMLKSVGFSIALNAAPIAKKAATTHVDTADIMDLLPLLAAFVDE